MKTSEDKILKYLSELMTDDERKEFEKEISFSPELSEKLNAVKNTLLNLNVREEGLDERYFTGLLPKVRRKIEKLSEPSFLQKIYYLVPTLAAALVGIMFLFKPANNFDVHYKDLATQVVNNISDSEVSRKYIDETEVDPVSLAEDMNNANDLSSLVPSSVELNDEIASQYLSGSVVEDYSTLQGLSDNELQKIADNLNSIKVK